MGGLPAYIPSPSQGVWNLGPLPVRAYALLIILGVVVATIVAIALRWAAYRWPLPEPKHRNRNRNRNQPKE